MASDPQDCTCAKHCSAGCHKMHTNIEETRKREREYWREQQSRDAARAAAFCTIYECHRRKSPSQLHDPNGLCTICHATQQRNGMLDEPGPCTAHWLCLQQPTRQCSFGRFQNDTNAPHWAPPDCTRPVCGRANHRFCDDHKNGSRGVECLRHRCDQPSLWDEDILLTSGEHQGSPDPAVQGFCSKQCVRKAQSHR